MTIQVFGSQAIVSYLNRAFSDTSPSNAIFKNQVAQVDAKGDFAFANAFAVSWAGLSNAALSKQVLTNVGILPSTDTSVTALEGALADHFAANASQTKDPKTGEVTADSRGTIVLQLAQILSGLEGTTTGAQAVYNTAATAWNNEVVTAYSYSSNVNNTTASTPTTPGTTAPVVTTFTLTKGADTVTGTASDDVIDGITADTLSSFDNIDGGAGTDTLTVGLSTNTAIPSGVSIKNVEKITLNAVSGAEFKVNASTLPGVTNLSVSNTGASSATTIDNGGSATINAIATAAVKVGTLTDNASGSVVNVTAGTTAAIIGSKLTAVSVKSGGTVEIDNSTGTTTSTGTTMTAVTLDAIGGAAGVKGAAISNLTWKNQTTTQTVTITNGTSTTLNLNVENVGYDGSTMNRDTVVLGSAATSATITAAGIKDALALDINALTTKVSLAGSAALNLTFGGTTSGLVTIDGSTATGGITLSSVPVSVKTLNTGAGNDTVNLAAAVAAGAAISLGAGDDKLTFATGGDLTNSGVIDGGAGTDSIAFSLAATATATSIKNFELIDIGGVTAAAILPATNITGITGVALTSPASGATVTGLPAGAGLTVTNQIIGVAAPIAATATGANTLSLANAGGTADAFTVTFAGTDVTQTTNATTLTVDGIENFNVVSGGTTLNNVLGLADTSLQTLTITGAKDLVVAFAAVDPAKNIQKVGTTPSSSTDAANGVKLIDASAATGKVTIDASPLTFTATQTTTVAPGVAAAATGDLISSVANAGLTIKGGTAADTITGTKKADTIIGGGGADVITGGLGADKITVLGNTSTIAISTKEDTGISTATTLTQPSVLTAGYDIITGVTAGTKIAITNGTNITAVPTVETAADTLMGKDSTVMFARGTYNANTGSFSFGAAGADTAMTYDVHTGNTGTAGAADFYTVILVGYVPSATATTAAFASNIATITL